MFGALEGRVCTNAASDGFLSSLPHVEHGGTVDLFRVILRCEFVMEAAYEL